MPLFQLKKSWSLVILWQVHGVTNNSMYCNLLKIICCLNSNTLNIHPLRVYSQTAAYLFYTFSFQLTGPSSIDHYWSLLATSTTLKPSDVMMLKPLMDYRSMLNFPRRPSSHMNIINRFQEEWAEKGTTQINSCWEITAVFQKPFP